MDKKIFCFTVYPKNKELGKVWFVLCVDQFGNRIKKYGHLARYNTVEAKERETQRIIAEFKSQSDKNEKHRNNLVTHLSWALENIKYRLEPNSYDNYFSTIKMFAQWYRPALVQDKKTCPGKFIEWMHLQGYNRNYIRRNRTVLNTLIKDVIKAGVWVGNPFAEIIVKKQKTVSKLPFSKAQISELKNYISAHDVQLWFACELMYYMYFRPDELRLLKISDIIFTEMNYQMRPEMCKDDDSYKKVIPVPLHTKFLKLKGLPGHYYIFSHYGKPGVSILGENNMPTRHMNILRKLGYSAQYSFYSWVHTGCKAGAMSGIPIKQLQKQKGHSDLRMFDEYLKNLGVEDFVQLRNNFPKI